jgi:indole-3-glycerol phosphate synthase
VTAQGTGGPDLLLAITAAARRRVEIARALGTRHDPRPTTAVGGADRGLRFARALSRRGRVNIIAECKHRSPSRGILRRDYDPVALARAYEEAGAAAISVLTEPAFFNGDLAHLEAVAGAVTVPVLRKDFIVDESQVLEARTAGASAVLLIVASLSDEELRRLLAACDAEGLAALVEVHTHDELGRAVGVGARIIGVNSRNLRTLAVDPAIAASLVGAIPADVVAVAESGLKTREEVARLRGAGYDAFLVGERLVTGDDPGEALRELV